MVEYLLSDVISIPICTFVSWINSDGKLAHYINMLICLFVALPVLTVPPCSRTMLA